MFASDFSGLAYNNLFLMLLSVASCSLLAWGVYWLYSRVLERQLPSWWRLFPYWMPLSFACTVATLAVIFLFSWVTRVHELGLVCCCAGALGMVFSMLALRSTRSQARYPVILELIFFTGVLSFGVLTVVGEL